jgi:hypothetical protein
MIAGMAKRGPKSPMTPEHKAALAKGRVEGRVVREYLEALRANRPSPGRKRTAESVAKRLAAIEQEFAGADPVKELRLVQERLDLEAELRAFSVTVDMGALESEFVMIAKSYSDRNGVSYAAWRTVGVTPAVLKSAGVTR